MQDLVVPMTQTVYTTRTVTGGTNTDYGKFTKLYNQMSSVCWRTAKIITSRTQASRNENTQPGNLNASDFRLINAIPVISARLIGLTTSDYVWHIVAGINES